MQEPLQITGRQAAAARALLGLKQIEVAAAIGVTSSTLANFETGQRGLKATHLQRLTDYYLSHSLSFLNGRAWGVFHVRDEGNRST